MFHKVFNGPQPEDLPVLFFETKKLRMFAKTLVYIEIVNIVLVLLLEFLLAKLYCNILTI